MSTITIKVSFLSEHSRNSLYLDQNSPLGIVNELFHSCSVNNSVKNPVQGLGAHVLVAVTFKSLHSPANCKHNSSGFWGRMSLALCWMFYIFSKDHAHFL